MSLHQSLIDETCVGVGLTTTPKGLLYITDPLCSAAIWRRQPLQQFQEWIDSLPTAMLPRGRMILRADMVRDAMNNLAESHGLPDSQERKMLVDDIAALAAIFSHIMDSIYLRLRMDVIEVNACGKFHIDAVTARLICTYRGRATQYCAGTTDDDSENIYDTPTGCPMIMRGTMWPSDVKPVLLHRSPPTEGTETSRLVLMLDPIADIEMDEQTSQIH